MKKFTRTDKWINNSCFPLEIQTTVRHTRDFEIHTHDFYEIVFIREGSAVHIVNGEEFIVSAGDVFILKDADSHGFKNIHNLVIANCIFLIPELLKLPLDLRLIEGFNALFIVHPVLSEKTRFRNRLRLSPEQFNHTTDILDCISRECREMQSGYQTAVFGHFIRMLVFLSRIYIPQNFYGTYSSRLSPAIIYIENNYMNKITIGMIAKEAGLSGNQFLRVFHRHYQSSPVEYLLRIRVYKACQMLRATDKNITDIAFSTGFNDSNYFSRIFKKITGENPRGYRKKNQWLG
ncbi:MAG: hypothetical protein A2096_01560 [Spirochaetes bacterium GWF1_41_5]|nr:MAG: hypothetical protein A2096_01560 [Spirochaetes bacterium GWF1_41_5]HBE02453.1 hypothetical protein [Spirochaetia bacterium]